MKEKMVRLSSPWESVHHAMSAFFGKDEQVTVSDIDQDNMTITITVSDYDKFLALDVILVKEYTFGNVKLFINVEANVDSASGIRRDLYPSELINNALAGNGWYEKVETLHDPATGMEFNFCVFKKLVVQFFNDDLTDPNGNESTLAQNIAEQIFRAPSIMFCTSTDDPE